MCGKIIKKAKINKKVILGGIGAIALVVVVIALVGSNTIERRKHLQEIESDIVDESTSQEAHITGSLMEIKEKRNRRGSGRGFMCPCRTFRKDVGRNVRSRQDAGRSSCCTSYAGPHSRKLLPQRTLHLRRRTPGTPLQTIRKNDTKELSFFR